MRVAILFIVSLFMIASVDRGVRVENVPSAKSIPVHIASNPVTTSPAKPALVIRRITTGPSSSAAAARAMNQTEQELREVVSLLNQTLTMPHDLYITLSDCDSSESFYDVEKHEIVVCQDMLKEFRYLFSREIRHETELRRAVLGATTFFFFHEIGHALVSAWDLPVTGREEDAVDQFSTIMLLGFRAKGEQMVLDGADVFRLSAESTRRKLNPTLYWEPHSQDEQRYFDTICLLYGNHPDKYEYLVKSGMLPQERAMNCEEDFARIARSWRVLLEKHLNNPSQNPLSQLSVLGDSSDGIKVLPALPSESQR